MKYFFTITAVFLYLQIFSQQPYRGSFVAKLGDDTVIVETYNMTDNHLYGKAFLRYPEDQIGIFDFHFNDDGSIKHYSIAYMNPDTSYLSNGIAGVFWEGDSCTWYYAGFDGSDEYRRRHYAKHLDFIGGWTPTISLIEWNCLRLLKSNKSELSMVLLNDYIGTRDIAMYKGANDTILFGGPFLEYTRITTTPDGRITTYDGTATPWNYVVTRHELLDVDTYAKRLSKTPKIGVPSPEVVESFLIRGDTVRISYGKPARRGRKIFGGVVPYDSVWRTGAGDPTTIDLPYSIKIAGKTIPAGKYSLYTIPGVDEWKLIFNTDLKAWPTDPNRSADFAQTVLKIRKLSGQQERFTIRMHPSPKGGTITFSWDDTEAYTDFEILRKSAVRHNSR